MISLSVSFGFSLIGFRFIGFIGFIGFSLVANIVRIDLLPLPFFPVALPVPGVALVAAERLADFEGPLETIV